MRRNRSSPFGIVERGPDSQESTLDGFRDLAQGDVPNIAPEAVHPKRVPTKDGCASSSEGPR